MAVGRWRPAQDGSRHATAALYPEANHGAPFQGAARNHLPEVGRLRVLCRRVDAVADIVGHVAFYTDRVDVVVGT